MRPGPVRPDRRTGREGSGRHRQAEEKTAWRTSKEKAPYPLWGMELIFGQAWALRQIGLYEWMNQRPFWATRRLASVAAVRSAVMAGCLRSRALSRLWLNTARIWR